MSNEVGIFRSVIMVLWLLAELGEDLVGDAVAYAFRGRSANPGISGLIYVCLGAVIGFASAMLIPVRLVAAYPISGASLALAPVGAGLAMHWYGSWQQRRENDRSWLATFWGGALLAFGIALMRWIFIRNA